MAHNQGSMILREILARELKQLRLQAGMTLDEAAPKLFWSAPTLSRIERGVQGVDVHSVRSMLDLYGASDRWTELTDLAVRAQQRGWWHHYNLGQKAFYVSYETDAVQVREYTIGYVPGLLQTADCVRALYDTGSVTRDFISKQVEVRMIRQRRLTSDTNPLELVAVIDESALHRPIGGTDVHRAQLIHLAEAAMLDSVTVQVVPNSVGAHPGLASGFVLLNFGDLGEADIAYVEHALGALSLEKSDDVDVATLTFDRLQAESLDPSESLALIQRLAGKAKD